MLDCFVRRSWFGTEFSLFPCSLSRPENRQVRREATRVSEKNTLGMFTSHTGSAMMGVKMLGDQHHNENNLPSVIIQTKTDTVDCIFIFSSIIRKCALDCAFQNFVFVMKLPGLSFTTVDVKKNKLHSNLAAKGSPPVVWMSRFTHQTTTFLSK